MKSVKIEVSEFELSLLLGLVDGDRMEYERKAKAIPVYGDYASLARSFKVLHEKLRSAKPIPAESLKT